MLRWVHILIAYTTRTLYKHSTYNYNTCFFLLYIFCLFVCFVLFCFVLFCFFFQFCGEVIAGLSLLSPSVMQLQHEEDSERCIWALLPRLSLYIMWWASQLFIPRLFPGSPVWTSYNLLAITITQSGAEWAEHCSLEPLASSRKLLKKSLRIWGVVSRFS